MMSDDYDPYSWALDAIAFERWFHDEEEINPRIEMVRDVLETLSSRHETVLLEYFFERLSMRDLMRRHGMTNPWYAHQAVHAAQAAFRKAWVKEHGEM